MLEGCIADVAFAKSFEELRWARAFVRRSEVSAWCYDLALFDARVLRGMPLAAARWGGSDIRENRAGRRDERRWRHEHQRFIYAGGDFVPWNPASWKLAVRAELLLPVDNDGRPRGIDNRGERLAGSLNRYHRVVDGRAVCPLGWTGFPYLDVRSDPSA